METNDISTTNLSLKSGIKLTSVNKLVEKYMRNLEKFGPVKIRYIRNEDDRGGRPFKNIWLNESQAFLVVTYMRNTEKSMDLKEEYVRKFASKGNKN
uniref:Rha family transcriptional regulator n=1 Tax=Lentilactobacillus hilgardii TaxID=1588 RepID=UPI00403F6878